MSFLESQVVKNLQQDLMSMMDNREANVAGAGGGLILQDRGALWYRAQHNFEFEAIELERKRLKEHRGDVLDKVGQDANVITDIETGSLYDCSELDIS
ncbi:unnamed protein product, partial [Amoebophrya sp. A25]|eukprot:GSA25T00019118001.1